MDDKCAIVSDRDMVIFGGVTITIKELLPLTKKSMVRALFCYENEKI